MVCYSVDCKAGESLSTTSDKVGMENCELYISSGVDQYRSVELLYKRGNSVPVG